MTNVVCIFLDDAVPSTLLRWPGDHDLDVMPYLRTQPHGNWVRLLGMRLDNPTCGPSRVTMSTGQHSRRHGAATNSKTANKWEGGVDPALKWPAILAANGVKNGFWGKYENGYPWQTRPGNQGDDWIPPGFEAVNGHRWHAFTFGTFGGSTGKGNGYFNYSLNVDGVGSDSDGTQTSYSTDVIFDDAIAWMTAKLGASEPFVAFLSLYAPHQLPDDAPPLWHERHDGLYVSGETYRTANHNVLMAGAPARHAETFSPFSQAIIDTEDAINRGGWRAMRAVDEGIEDVMDLLAAQNALDDTIVLFLADNSNLSGQHGRRRKARPWEESVTAYGTVRWPGAVQRDTWTSCGNHDWVPTLEDIYDVRMPHPPDGMSLRRVAMDLGWREYTLGTMEWNDVPQDDSYVQVADNQGGKLTRFHGAGGEMFVDLLEDPVEMTNVVTSPAYGERVTAARRAMDRMLAVQPKHPEYLAD